MASYKLSFDKCQRLSAQSFTKHIKFVVERTSSPLSRQFEQPCPIFRSYRLSSWFSPLRWGEYSVELEVVQQILSLQSDLEDISVSAVYSFIGCPVSFKIIGVYLQAPPEFHILKFLYLLLQWQPTLQSTISHICVPLL